MSYITNETIDELADHLHSNLSGDSARKFYKDFSIIGTHAKHNNIDFDIIWKKFSIWLLDDPSYGVINLTPSLEIKDVIKTAINVIKESICKNICEDEFEKVSNILAHAAIKEIMFASDPYNFIITSYSVIQKNSYYASFSSASCYNFIHRRGGSNTLHRPI